MEHQQAWHYANFRGDELLVIGHNPSRNDCILVRLSGLPMNEASALRKIAQSRAGQETASLIPLLQRMDSPNGNGEDWWTFLARKMQQRNSPVFILPIKEIQDSLDTDQKAIFKGYGKNRVNRSLDYLDRAKDFGGDDTSEFAETENIAVNKKTTKNAIPSRDLDYKMDMLLETLADESRRTQQLLGKLIVALTGEQTEPDHPKKAAPKTRKTKTTGSTGRKPKVQEAVHEAQ
jgi:hypothetical protein